jgi:small subunit ribosomal protein S1
MSDRDDVKTSATALDERGVVETSKDAVPARAAGKPKAAENDFAALLAASEAEDVGRASLRVGDVVRGRVIAVGQSTAFVAVGGKGEAQLDLTEFRDPETGKITLAEGDLIEATVTDDGGKSGSVVLKRTLGRGAHVSEELEQAFAAGIPVEGLVTGEIKGGYEVQIGHLRAFCPGSQMDLRRGSGPYVGERFQFRVTKIDEGGRNIVVSRRQLLEEEAAALAQKTWERIEVGAVLDGMITSLRDFGAFVDLGGVEGMIHISEVGYGRVGHPSEALQQGQVVKVQVIKVDAADDSGKRRQVGLSLKALAPDPWDSVRDKYPVGATVSGTVRKLESFGAFVELEPGLDGLVHVSKIALDRRISHPRQVLNVGDAAEVTIVSIDSEKRRIGLSMIERARDAEETTKARERAEEKAALEKQNETSGLGTLGDLLSSARKR